MATYKCSDCTHEIIANLRPSECEICGGKHVVLLDEFTAHDLDLVEKKIDIGIDDLLPISPDKTIIKKVDGKPRSDDLIRGTIEPPDLYDPHRIPTEIKGWNWGAFLLGFLWAIDNRVWVGMLCIIPYVGFLMAIILGFKGNAWAWKSRKWSSVTKFKSRQRKWAIAGIIVVVLFFIIGFLSN